MNMKLIAISSLVFVLFVAFIVFLQEQPEIILNFERPKLESLNPYGYCKYCNPGVIK